MSDTSDPRRIRDLVRERYGAIASGGAEQAGCGCGPAADGCCGGLDGDGTTALRLGYTAEDLAAAPAGSEMGLGCGNPQAIAALRPGETVLDLGSGGGFDCFLAARRVGPEGRVIGVDMTPEMLARARANAEASGLANVEFRLGEIEHLPLPDASVDVVISNCVVNLSPDKPAVWGEVWRILRPGGRVAISDVVALAPLPAEIRRDLALHVGCVAGASTVAELVRMLRACGFEEVRIDVRGEESRRFLESVPRGASLAGLVAAAAIEARKPGGD
jgi:arsenite methyltransferase